jgi:hypothetical protein
VIELAFEGHHSSACPGDGSLSAARDGFGILILYVGIRGWLIRENFWYPILEIKGPGLSDVGPTKQGKPERDTRVLHMLALAGEVDWCDLILILDGDGEHTR